ncbi:MAG: arsenite methyltransferase [Thermodesulfobacteriota bacterium]
MSYIIKDEVPVDGSGVDNSVKDAVREKYSKLARQITIEGSSSCCGGSAGQTKCDPITSNLYESDQSAGIPSEVLLTSLGCGNPTALARLNQGEVVLDLGSGGGIDVLISAKRVGQGGRVYGIDMSDEMLTLARDNQKKAGIDNVEFLKGEIENIPLPDSVVDVIISNCVINLSINKDRALEEAFRVLKPGGRLAVSDIVFRGTMPNEIRRNIELWIGCMAGALEENDYRVKLEKAGFTDISIEPTRVYNVDDTREFLTNSGIDLDNVATLVDRRIMSAFVRARKPKQSLI